MPALIDHDERRAEVAAAALTVLAETGYQDITIRRVAEAAGASTSVVTHYFANREELLWYVTEFFLENCRSEVSRLIAGSPRESLRRLIEWTVHDIDPVMRQLWLVVISGAAREQVVREALDAFLAWYDGTFEGLLEDAARAGELAPGADVERLQDELTIIVNGLVVSGLESPDRWSARRQQRALDGLLGRLGLPGEVEVG